MSDIAKTLPIRSVKSSQSRKMSTNWNSGNITPIFKKAKREEKGRKAMRALD